MGGGVQGVTEGPGVATRAGRMRRFGEAGWGGVGWGGVGWGALGGMNMVGGVGV